MADTPKTEDIAKMSVTDAKAMLPLLSDDQLADLKTLETNGGEDEGRVTMLAAIEAEQARRISTIGNGTGGQPPLTTPQASATAVTDGVPEGSDAARWWYDKYQSTLALASQRDNALVVIGEAIGADAYDATDTGVVDLDRVADLAVARIAALHDANEELTAVRAELADAKLHEQLGIAPIGAPLANYLHVTQLGASGFVLVMLDGENDIDLPPIPVFRTDFVQRSADVVVYDRPIALPLVMPAVRLTSVELRDDEGDVIDRCNMVPAMEAGGGRSVELPAGTLMFRQPDRSAAEAQRAAKATDTMKAA